MKYAFVDGSGNRYRFENGILTYDPMTADQSSSGMYSGDEPFSKGLEKKDIIRFVDVFERAIWSSEDHTDKRTMGSGTIIKIVGDEKARYYLRMNSDSMKEVQTFLATMTD